MQSSATPDSGIQWESETPQTRAKRSTLFQQVTTRHKNQGTPEASNVCHELCKSSRRGFHFDWQTYDTTVLLFYVHLCVPVHNSATYEMFQ